MTIANSELTVHSWLRHWAEVYGLPANYVTFDLETTGLITGLDLITEIGLVTVIDGMEIDRKLIVVDWTQDLKTNQLWLQSRLDSTAAHMQRKRRKYHVSYDRLATHDCAMHPEAAFTLTRRIFENIRARGDFLIGHNVWHFDIPFLEEHFYRVLDAEFSFLDNEIMDTGNMEKGLRLGILPWCGQSTYDYYQRVEDRSGRDIGWSLSEHCIPRYGLDRKYGLDLTFAHTADYDAYMTHLLFEHYRESAGSLTEDLIYGRPC